MIARIGEHVAAMALTCELPLSERTRARMRLEAGYGTLNVVAQGNPEAAVALMEAVLSLEGRGSLQAYCIGTPGAIRPSKASQVLWEDKDGFPCLQVADLREPSLLEMQPERVVVWPTSASVPKQIILQAIEDRRSAFRFVSGTDEEVVVAAVAGRGPCGAYVPGEPWFQFWGREPVVVRALADILLPAIER